MSIESLIEQIPLDGLMVALLDANSESESIQEKVFTIPDIELLRRFFPAKEISKAILGSYESQLALTFALKHQVTHLQRILNAISLSETIADIGVLTFLKTLFEGRPIPIIGFSSIGTHIQYRKEGLCRAFDYYDIQDCSNPIEQGPFCKGHLGEDWGTENHWPQSTQAKMFRFYGNIDNLGEYNENDLEKMVRNFWNNFSTAAVFVDGNSVRAAMTTMGIGSIEELNAMGTDGLRKRFLNMAKKNHPDKGGKTEEFQNTQQAFCILKQTLNQKISEELPL